MKTRRRTRISFVSFVAALFLYVPILGTVPAVFAGTNLCDVQLRSGDNIQAAIDRHGEGARICLSGTFRITSTIKPTHGTTLVGPATLVAGTSLLQAIDATKARGVRILQLTISGFVERAFKCGEESLVRDSYFHHNGRNGMGGGECHGMLVLGNEFAFNGGEEHVGSGAAGIKIAGSQGVVIRDNDVHDNLGNGIWCDAFCSEWLVEDNLSTGNSRKGIFLEKGKGAVIRHNIATDNNDSGHRVSGGIATVSSIGVEIYENTLGGNGEHGIKVWDDSRPYVLAEVTVRDNNLAGDDLSGCTEDGVTCLRNVNVGD